MWTIYLVSFESFQHNRSECGRGYHLISLISFLFIPYEDMVKGYIFRKLDDIVLVIWDIYFELVRAAHDRFLKSFKRLCWSVAIAGFDPSVIRVRSLIKRFQFLFKITLVRVDGMTFFRNSIRLNLDYFSMLQDYR